ncbi:MAG TPA: RNA ligase family protein [Clostridia bacterium]|jgi:hypothetical protein|nr:RNA ligase family protein [Clostridia bacterium]
MINKSIYPKTVRIPIEGDQVVITEKLDGSNLVIFKLNGKLYVAARNWIFDIENPEDFNEISYSGLQNWLKIYKSTLLDTLQEGVAICGEWLGMGTIKYSIDKFDKRYYMFATANVDNDFNLSNLTYYEEYFALPFTNQEIPYFIGIRPEVTRTQVMPNKKFLDSLYEKYTSVEKRDVEGFIVIVANTIKKYVRLKGGKLIEHFVLTD